MILTAHQSSYLPWLGFFHKLILSDIFVILDGVQFEKNSFTNRNKIKGPKGSFWLTVPVNLKGHMQKKISDIKIADYQDWKKRHLKSIEQNYSKSPFYKDYISFFKGCYSKDWSSLSDLNYHMLEWFFKQLDIKVKISKMSDFEFQGKKTDLVLEICHKFEADTYIFGALGKNYVVGDKFTKQGIKIHFQNYKHPKYQQLHGEFVSHLSAVDLLFNHGPDSGRILREGNITKEDLIKEKIVRG